MNVATLGVTKEQAIGALKEYRAHRGSHDKLDWEIERIYRAISRGNVVISAFDSIRRGGLDDLGRPRLALMRADQPFCVCDRNDSSQIILRAGNTRSRAAEWYFRIPWPNRPLVAERWRDSVALLPRIPPQHRPKAGTLANYHMLWEADWTDIPRDPYLLRRIGKDAFIILAAWDLSEVEISVLRAHQ